jgi:hypothetical protein
VTFHVTFLAHVKISKKLCFSVIPTETENLTLLSLFETQNLNTPKMAAEKEKPL